MNKGNVLKIKDGRLCCKGCSFALPDNFYFEFPKFPNLLTFHSEDGLVHIEVSFERSVNSARAELDEVLSMDGVVRLSETESVTRGGEAAGVYYGFESDGHGGSYEERYDFKAAEKGVNQISVLVYVGAVNGKPIDLSIHKAVARREVKDFLNSIEYY